ncbi:Insertion sequence IS21 putative ATP-binding protein [Petrimonas mucosa]|jgi:DNA replication protein DnaC|uniref:Insertion sequence IS21 putative ATP-binding protein n=2 Tax=Petrimonas mucosa TaxID=1642646 RepID=A0A1G4G4L6_9BACT|nr:Insertion sequence IS21 putative ATP-binding protein [Petrimonas mucosa]SCM56101.1 Insertion sequence IS21 putative ATP-binding protein [Petrimonas mucosa]SCM58966.1 Insertion sequence IS21 putative ATP-binding protein [Petrimonas mucosa]
MMDTINRQITAYSKELRLPVFRRDYKELATEAARQGLDYEAYLVMLMEREYELRLENRKKAQIRNARFPSKMYLSDLERDQLPPGAREKLPLLERLDFIPAARNVILSGNPGTGKTHIAIGLGLKACMQGYKVLFTTVHRLLTQLRESHSGRTLKQVEAQFEKYDLVICDEFGYVSFDKQGSELLFNHLSLRTGRKSTIITTNLGFDRWEEIFGDPVLTAALVDRVTHKAYLVNMSGDSYRLKETEKMMNGK